MIIVTFFLFLHHQWGKLYDFWYGSTTFFNWTLPLIICSTLLGFGMWAWNYREPLLSQGLFDATVRTEDGDRYNLGGVLTAYVLAVAMGVGVLPFVLWATMYATLVLGPFVAIYFAVLHFARREKIVKEIVGRLEGA